MNYSDDATFGRKVVSKRKKDNGKRVLILWAITLIIGVVVGCIVTSLMFKVTESPDQAAVQKYGTVDGKVFTSEMSMDWSNGADLGFSPLDVAMDVELQEFIYCLSYGYNLDFPFIMGLIQQESGFQTEVVSSTNDYGLMQINSCNHEWLTEQLGVTDFQDPYQNARSGLYILRKLFEKHEDPAKVLMAYNMGETGAKRLWDKGVFETNYSKEVLEKAAAFSEQIEGMKKND